MTYTRLYIWTRGSVRGFCGSISPLSGGGVAGYPDKEEYGALWVVVVGQGRKHAWIAGKGFVKYKACGIC